MSPAQLAHAIGRTSSYVSRLELDGIKTPPPDVTADVARALQLDERYLLRLIGYLSTVPDDTTGTPLFPADDPRRELAELLANVPDGRLAALRVVLEMAAEG